MASGHEDFSVRYWQIISIENKPYLQLIWSSHQSTLYLQDANTKNVQKLSDNNTNLLKQLGAIEKPLMLSDVGKNAAEATINRDNGESSQMGATSNNDNNNNAKNNCCIS